MWQTLIAGLILGFATAASAADHEGRDRHDRGGQQGFRAPAVVSAPSRINRVESRPVYRVQPQLQSQPQRRIEPRPMESGAATVDRARVGNNQPQVQEWSGSRVRGAGHHDRDRHFHGHQGNGNAFHGSTTVYFPYYPNYPYYPYYFNNGSNNYNSYPYGNSYNESPSVYFICYQEDQVSEDRYHISCPYPMAWYSTDPNYSSYEYQSHYRPEYVCPNYGASHYREFGSAYEATTWWNNVCNSWQRTGY